MSDFSKQNRAAVLEQVEQLMKESEQFKCEHPATGYKRYHMRDVCDRISIFDWWNDTLSYSQLKDMRSFLVWAGALGYDGYVCFKVGASGCANGMWACKKESENGYSPDGEFIYRSFTPEYLTYDAQFADGRLFSTSHMETWRKIRRKDIETAIA